MDRIVLAFFLLAVIISSGCNGNSKSEGITVNKLSLEPQEIRQGKSASLILQVQNSGLLEGKIDIGNKGKKILTDYCPDYFNIQEVKTKTTGEKDGNTVYTLNTGERISIAWQLNQKAGKQIPNFGYSCNIKLQVPFNYSTTSYKQLEIVEEKNLETGTKLKTKVSEGPLGIDMKLTGSTANKKGRFLSSQNVSLLITAYNRKEDSQSKYTGLVEMSDINIRSVGNINIDESCVDRGSAVLATGENKIFRCKVTPGRNYEGPSSRGEIIAKVNYTYVKTLESRKLKVKSSAE